MHVPDATSPAIAVPVRNTNSATSKRTRRKLPSRAPKPLRKSLNQRPTRRRLRRLRLPRNTKPTSPGEAPRRAASSLVRVHRVRSAAAKTAELSIKHGDAVRILGLLALRRENAILLAIPVLLWFLMGERRPARMAVAAFAGGNRGYADAFATAMTQSILRAIIGLIRAA